MVMYRDRLSIWPMDELVFFDDLPGLDEFVFWIHGDLVEVDGIH